jgi:hypothetical protein
MSQHTSLRTSKSVFEIFYERIIASQEWWYGGSLRLAFSSFIYLGRLISEVSAKFRQPVYNMVLYSVSASRS